MQLLQETLAPIDKWRAQKDEDGSNRKKKKKKIYRSAIGNFPEPKYMNLSRHNKEWNFESHHENQRKLKDPTFRRLTKNVLWDTKVL
jgi:hypothetical protein